MMMLVEGGKKANVACVVLNVGWASFFFFFQIVRQDRTMEEIVFPVPNICEFLTTESKLRIYYTTERDEQGSKINDFFLRAEDLFNEMNWQKKLRGRGPRRCSCLGLAGSSAVRPPLLFPGSNASGQRC